MNPFNRNAALWIVIVLLLALLYSVFQGGTTRTAGNTISYSDFVKSVELRQIQDVRNQGNTITGTFREPRNGVQKFATYVPSTPVDEQLMPILIKNVDRVDAGLLSRCGLATKRCTSDGFSLVSFTEVWIRAA